jgi:hypothetical protein
MEFLSGASRAHRIPRFPAVLSAEFWLRAATRYLQGKERSKM